MNVILLSGGAGERLWPISTDQMPKQFLKIFKDEYGNYQSMIQYMYSNIKSIDSDSTVIIASGKEQAEMIKQQLGEQVEISAEPCRKNTFPAILLATLSLRDVKGIDESESVIVCPVDPYVDRDYFEAISELCNLVDSKDNGLVLMGIAPTYPSEKYGYIIPKTVGKISDVSEFKEKPDSNIAKEYIKKGALWNCGVFAFKIGYLIEKAHEILEFNGYNDFLEKYDSLEKISFDYAIVERENNISVMRFAGKWDDLGTWNSLVHVFDNNVIGNGLVDTNSSGSVIINELEMPIMCLGVEDIIIAASENGILVSKKSETENLKKHLERIKK